MTREIESTDSFPLKVWSGLFKEKHWTRMGQAIWLFGTLIDKVTKEENEKGYVLGGKPITYADLEKEMPLTRRQYVRHIEILRDNGYISTKKTPHGLIIVINKSKKFAIRKRDTKVTTSSPEAPIKSPASDNNDSPDGTETSHVSIDTKDDNKGTEDTSRPNESQNLWIILYPIFKLPEDSMNSYLPDINETLQRLGAETAMAAVREFKKNREDHPPGGRVKSISQFLHFRKIDEYVAMLPAKKIYRYYTCPVCFSTVQVEASEVSEGMLELSGMMHHEEIRKDTTATVISSLKAGFKPEQIRAILESSLAGK